MKKTTIYIVLAMLCLNFSSIAQQNQAIDVTTIGLQIGQQVPDVVLSNIHNYKTKTAKLSDFKGKLLILDFWATWCSPCVAMMPKMEALQKAFEGQLQFLPVTYQSAKEALPFLEKQRKGQASILPEVTDDKALHQLFPHIYLPHYVWIDGEGVVKAITDYTEVTAENIQKMVSNEQQLVQKKDMKIQYDRNKPFLINGNGGDGQGLLYHSIFGAYIEGIGSGYSFDRLNTDEEQKNRKISCRNLSLSDLYKLAYGEGVRYFGANRIILESENLPALTPTGSENNKEWIYKNAFCYELILPPALAEKAFKLMQQDLDLFFPAFKATVEKRMAKCLVLKRTSDMDKLRAQSAVQEIRFDFQGASLRNAYLNRLISTLTVKYMQHSTMPLIDETGYLEKVDMDIKANLSNVGEVNAALEKYDIRFVEADREIEMLVIRDRK